MTSSTHSSGWFGMLALSIRALVSKDLFRGDVTISNISLQAGFISLGGVPVPPQ